MSAEIIEGIVQHITYSNSSNGYTVCDIEVNNVLVPAVGTMPALACGESVRLTGEWTNNPAYGEQFTVSLFERTMPKEAGAIFLYLSSGIIHGVGTATARKIVDAFGAEAINVITNTPEALAKIKGISKDQALSIHASLIEKRGVQSTIMFLQSFGITTELAMQAHKALSPNAVEQIKANPYILCDRIAGIHFEAADKIAASLDIPLSDSGRIQSGITHVLRTVASQMGHTYLPEEHLTEYAARFLSLDEELIENQYTAMLTGGALYAFESYDEGRCLQLSLFYKSEHLIAKKLQSLLRTPSKEQLASLDKYIRSSEEKNGLSLSAEQKNAVAKAVYGGATVITGGPGTGKTTIIRTIIDCLSSLGMTFCLAAPTGRAAKRMSDSCGCEAKTIHRLLELDYKGAKAPSFSHNEDEPIDADFVIIDELSMVDTLLMASLMRAIAPDTGLVLLGDADQLPSVGAGSVLKDIISSGTVTTLHLTHIYRQAAQSMIVTNAHSINSGDVPRYNKADGDFFLVTRQNPSFVADTIVTLCMSRLPKKYGFDPLTDIQVISPVKKSLIGVFHLNAQLQEALNPPGEGKHEHRIGEFVFREGDKVMQTENDYNLPWTRGSEGGQGIYNGDMGQLHHIDKQKRTVTVCFDDMRIAHYPFDKLSELTLSYAVTVHKSQGSEFPCVVMPVHRTSPMLMTRNLFYTAVTRAKSLVVLVGVPEAIETMVYNNTEQKRYSSLINHLQG